MITIVFALTRREGMTREEFQRYWSERHGPLVAQHAETLLTTNQSSREIVKSRLSPGQRRSH